MPTKLFTFVVTFLIFTGVIISQSSKQKSLSVTVYNSNLGVVKDLRTINIPSGKSKIEIADVAQQIDPTSVHINWTDK